MRVAIFSDTFLPQINGVVTAVINMAVGLAKKGHNVLIVTVKTDKTSKNIELHKNIEIFRFRSFTLPTYDEYKIMGPSLGIKALKKLIKFKPDIMHSHTLFGVGWAAYYYSILLDKPIVGTHHTFYSEYLQHVKLDIEFMKNFTNKYTATYYNRMNIVTSPSLSLKRDLVKYGVKKPVRVLPNSLDINKFRLKEDRNKLKEKYGLTNKTLMYMGRVSYEKSIDILLDAFKIILDKDSDVRFVVVGSGPNFEDIKTYAKKLGVEDRTVFTGVKRGQELIDLLFMADIFATASTTENQPMSIIEAMACGLPLVGVNARGVPELVRDGKNGLIAKPNNSEDIANKILKLFRDYRLRLKMGKMSREISKEYSEESVTNKLVELYRGILSKEK